MASQSRILSLCTLLLITACGKSSFTAAPPKAAINTPKNNESKPRNTPSSENPIQVKNNAIDRLEVQSAKDNIEINENLQFSAIAFFSDGSREDVSIKAKWSSSQESVASIDGRGLSLGKAAGSTEMEASYEGVSGSKALVINEPKILRIKISPNNVVAKKGTNVTFTAAAEYSDGSSKDITKDTVWSSTTTATATITSSGVATAVNNGKTDIGASYSGMQSSTPMTILSSGLKSATVVPATATIHVDETRQFELIGTLEDNSIVNLSDSAEWSSSVPALASINKGLATGLLDPSKASETTISAKVANFAPATALLKVQAPTLLSMDLNPKNSSTELGSSVQFALLGTFDYGPTRDLTSTATWASSDNTVAAMNASGKAQVSATKAGVIEISAAYSGMTAKTNLYVLPARELSNWAGVANVKSVPGQKLGKQTLKIKIKNIRSGDANFASTFKVMSVDFLSASFTSDARIADPVFPNLFEQTFYLTFYYKIVPETTRYNHQWTEFTGKTSSNVNITLSKYFIYDIQPAGVDPTPTKFLDGTEGHPQASCPSADPLCI